MTYAADLPSDYIRGHRSGAAEVARLALLILETHEDDQAVTFPTDPDILQLRDVLVDKIRQRRRADRHAAITTLAEFICREVPDEPSRGDEGAVACAIRIIRDQGAKIDALQSGPATRRLYQGTWLEPTGPPEPRPHGHPSG